MTNTRVPVPFIRWRDQLAPGEPFRVPAQWVMPHAGDFWGEPKHVVEMIDQKHGDWACLGTYALSPFNEHLARHWVYSAELGDTHVWNDEDDEAPTYFRYLGVYRFWGLSPNDWETGTLGFAPDH
jgi:hypothetical protein